MPAPLTRPSVPAFPELLARILLSLLFIMAGLAQAMDLQSFGDQLEADGLPRILTGFVFYFLIGSGLALSLGLMTRIVALSMAGFCLVSGALAYGDLTQPTDMTMLLKNISLSGGYLFVALHGAGRYSVDDWRARRDAQ